MHKPKTVWTPTVRSLEITWQCRYQLTCSWKQVRISTSPWVFIIVAHLANLCAIWTYHPVSVYSHVISVSTSHNTHICWFTNIFWIWHFPCFLSNTICVHFFSYKLHWWRTLNTSYYSSDVQDWEQWQFSYPPLLVNSLTTLFILTRLSLVS